DPGNADALMLRAILYCEAGQDGRAVPLLRKVLEQDPSRRMARYHLSQALARTDRAEDARRELAEVLRPGKAERVADDVRVQRDNIDLQVRAAEAVLGSGRADEGRRLLEKVLARDPHHAEALRLQAAYRERRP